MVNRAFSDMLGYSQDQLQQMKFDDITYSDDTEENVIIYQQLINREIDHFSLIKRYIHRDGSIVWANLSVSHFTGNMADEDEANLYTIAIAENITERKLAEQELQRSEALFRVVFENSADGISVVNTSSLIIMSNRAYQNLVGYSADKLSTMTVRDYVHPDDIDQEEALFQHALKHHEDSYQLELRIIRSDKTIRWIAASVGMVWDTEGNYQYAVTTSLDITESRNIKLTIENSEKRFRAIFENASLPISITRDDRVLGMFNRAFCDMLGYSADELIQMKFDDYTYPDDRAEDLSKYQQLVRGDIDSYTLIKRYIHRDGSIIWVNISVSPFTDNIEGAGGENLYSIAIIENITERKQAELALKESEKWHRQISGLMSDIAFSYNYDADNDKFVLDHALGQFVIDIKEFDLRGSGLEDYDPNYAQQLLVEIKNTLNGQITEREYRFIDSENQIKWKYIKRAPIWNQNQTQVIGFYGIEQDVTERKLAELALKESEEQYRTIFKNSLIGIFRSTLNGRYLSVNPALVKMLGYSSEDELYQLDLDRDVYIDPEARHTPERQEAYKNADIIEDDQIYLRKKNGDTLIGSVRVKVIRDDDGNILYFEGSTLDITEQHRQAEEIKQLNQDLERRVKKRTEQLALANEQLLELDRLRAKFIADISHEMRTPLSVLNTRLYLLQHSKNKDSLERHIQGFRIQLDRLEEFVENAFEISIIDMSRDNVVFEKVSLNIITEDVIKALIPRAEVIGLSFNYQLDPILPLIMGVENHLSQVVTNLINNAIKYTEAGQIQVTTGKDSITNRVYLRVEDTGMGIADEDIPHLFSRFYRGQRAGQSTISGSGLGLSIVKELVDEHRGLIDVESKINDGSTFTVWLPI
jgi:PAS domain S-box-containing protein